MPFVIEPQHSMDNNELPVEVAYANAERQVILTCKVPPGVTVQQAIHISGILNLFPEIDLSKQGVGIYSQRVSLDSFVKVGDRIEIYRPLQIDPKQARKLRAQKTKRNSR